MTQLSTFYNPSQYYLTEESEREKCGEMGKRRRANRTLERTLQVAAWTTEKRDSTPLTLVAPTPDSYPGPSASREEGGKEEGRLGVATAVRRGLRTDEGLSAWI